MAFFIPVLITTLTGAARVLSVAAPRAMKATKEQAAKNSAKSQTKKVDDVKGGIDPVNATSVLKDAVHGGAVSAVPIGAGALGFAFIGNLFDEAKRAFDETGDIFKLISALIVIYWITHYIQKWGK